MSEYCGRFVYIALATLCLMHNALAYDPHCGGESRTGSSFKPSKADNHPLEIVLHFNPKSAEIPKECLARLLTLSEQVKTGLKGKLIIRSTTSTDSSSEMDLAIASERLEQIKNFLRNDRLALRAMQLELYSRPPLHTVEGPGDASRLVEIYSSPVN